MQSYIIQTCGGGKDRKNKPLPQQQQPDPQHLILHQAQGRGWESEIVCATSAPKWPEEAIFKHCLFPPSNVTRQQLFCLFSFHTEKTLRQLSWFITSDTVRYGQYFFFRWLLLNVLHADTVNHRARTVLQNWPPALLFLLLLPKSCTQPYTGQPSEPLWIKYTPEQEGDRDSWAQPLPPSSPPLSLLLQSVAHIFFPLLFCI